MFVARSSSWLGLTCCVRNKVHFTVGVRGVGLPFYTPCLLSQRAAATEYASSMLESGLPNKVVVILVLSHEVEEEDEARTPGFEFPKGLSSASFFIE